MKKYFFALSAVALAGFLALTITSCGSTQQPEAEIVAPQATYTKPDPRPSTVPEGSGSSVSSGSGSSY